MPGVAAVDLGGTNIKAAIATWAGEIVAERVIPTRSEQGPSAVLAAVATLLDELQQQAGLDCPHGGIGLPGLVDREAGRTRFLPNLPTHWRDVPVAEELLQRTGIQFHLLNDARLATLGELRFGHGRDDPRASLAFFSIGTGVGGGIALEGQLRLGPLGAAGELGHQTLFPEGPRCGCGNRGCLEAIASGPALIAQGVRLLRSGLAPRLFELTAGDAGRVTPQIMSVAAATDATVRETIQDAARAIGIAAANVVTILHPRWIVLGGGVAEIGDLLTETVQAVIRERVGMFPPDDVRVVRSLLGERAGLMGAIAWGLQQSGCDTPKS